VRERCGPLEMTRVGGRGLYVCHGRGVHTVRAGRARGRLGRIGLTGGAHESAGGDA
jgi:hypothetical protein